MQTIKNNILLLKIAGRTGKAILLFMIFRNIVASVKVVLMSLIIPSSILRMISTDDYSNFWIFVGIFCGIEVFDLLFINWIEKTRISKKRIKMEDDIILSLLRHSSEIDMSCFDDKEFYDKNILAINSITGAVDQAMNVFVVLIGGIIAVLLNLGYVSQISVTSIPFILIVVVSTAIIKATYSRYAIKIRALQAGTQRKIDYNFEFRANFDHAKEIRVDKINRLHHDAFSNSYKTTLSIVKKALKKTYVLVTADEFLNGMLVKVILLVVLAYKALVRQEISAIDVIVIYNATINVCGGFGSLVQTMITLDSASVYSGMYTDFIQYTNKMGSGDKSIEDINEIEFRNVGFSYNGTDEILKGVSAVIKKGMKVALVGQNGAGKSTLFKLLLRFYDPEEGTILVNGHDIKEYDIQLYRKMYSVLFQDVKTINATIEENVTFGEKVKKENVDKALKEAGIYGEIDKLPQKERTNLGLELFEDGIDLSGGQKQRLLLARAIYKDSPVILLDEPTAHVDMKNELEFFQAIHGKFADKIVFFITHRLVSAKNADLIIVLNENGILEMGRHNDLMQRDGLYKKMFDIQLKNYEVEGQ